MKEEVSISFLRLGETEEESLPITSMQVLNKLNKFCMVGLANSIHFIAGNTELSKALFLKYNNS